MGKVSDFIKQNRHILWALCYLSYLTLYIIAERVVTDNYFVSYLPIDDAVPFCEWFVFLYVLWFPFLFFGALIALSDKRAFRRQMLFIGISFSLTLIFDMLFPNGQDLRPTLTGDLNVAERLCNVIYAADTNTNVLPSMHVLGTFAVTGSLLSSEKLRRGWYVVPLIILSVMICASTVFVKQHSVLDVLSGIAFGVVMSVIMFIIPRRFDKKREMKKGEKAQKVI